MPGFGHGSYPYKTAAERAQKRRLRDFLAKKLGLAPAAELNNDAARKAAGQRVSDGTIIRGRPEAPDWVNIPTDKLKFGAAHKLDMPTNPARKRSDGTIIRGRPEVPDWVNIPVDKLKFGAVPVPKSPTPPAPPPANPYLRLPRAEVAKALLQAVQQDDIGTLNLIHEVYADCARWHVTGGGWIGGQEFSTPIIFFAVDGGGLALQWLIDKGADLTAESNIAASPVVAFAASKGQAAAVTALLQAMQIKDLKVEVGSSRFESLADVARHYGHPALAQELQNRLALQAPVIVPKLPPRRKELRL